MKLKTIVAGALLGVSSLAAQAAFTPLDALHGAMTWKFQGLTSEFNAGAFGGVTDETTWGVGYISQIGGAGQLWQAGSTDGTYLYYMLYGIADYNISDDGFGHFHIYNVGASNGSGDGKIHLDIYRTTSLISSIFDGTANPGTRTGYSTDSLLAALGSPYLQVTFQPNKASDQAPLALCTGANGTPTGIPCMTNPGANEALSTLVQTTNSDHLPASGVGDFFADVVGGTAATKWDTNGLPFGYDFDGHFTLIPNVDSFGGACTAAQVAANECFAGNVNDPIRSFAIPEPGSLALFGSALIGLAALRRRWV